jgi:hypothetical protein
MENRMMIVTCMVLAHSCGNFAFKAASPQSCFSIRHPLRGHACAHRLRNTGLGSALRRRWPLKDRKGIMMAEPGEKKEGVFGGFFSNMFGGEEDSPDKGRVVVSVSFLMMTSLALYLNDKCV